MIDCTNRGRRYSSELSRTRFARCEICLVKTLPRRDFIQTDGAQGLGVDLVLRDHGLVEQRRRDAEPERAGGLCCATAGRIQHHDDAGYFYRCRFISHTMS